MKDSGVKWLYDIPQEWTVCRVKNAFTYKKRIVNEKCVDYERLALTLNGVIKRDKSDTDGLQPEKFEGYQILEKNELVFKLIDLQNISTSRVGLSPYTGIVSPAYIVLSNEQVDNRFAYYYFYSMYLRCIFNQLGSDMVRSCLNAKDLLELPYLIFNLKEQKMIADYLDKECEKINGLIAHEQTMIEQLKEYKQTVITEAVTKGLDRSVPMKDSGVEWIGEINAKFTVIRLKYLLTKKLSYGTNLAGSFYDEIKPRYIRITDIQENKLIDDREKMQSYCFEDASDYLVTCDDILFARSGATAGKTYIIKEDECGGVYAGYLILCRLNKRIINPKFLYYFTKCSRYDSWCKSILIQSTIQNINAEKYANIYVPICDIIEQNQIVSHLDKKCFVIDKLISIKQEKIEKLIEHKKSLIYEYVTGKKEVA